MYASGTAETHSSGPPLLVGIRSRLLASTKTYLPSTNRGWCERSIHWNVIIAFAWRGRGALGALDMLSDYLANRPVKI